MKTARFETIVQKKGTPETYLAFSDPAKDRGFQAAIKSGRVMTVFQDGVGQRSDHGEIGYYPGHSRQFLIFPKSLKAYAGGKVVGIKYELLDNSEGDSRPVTKTTSTPASKTGGPVSKGHSQAKPQVRIKASKAPKAPKVPKAPEASKAPKVPKVHKAPKASKASKAPKHSNVLDFPSPAKAETSAADLKKFIRQAMKLLEDGKAVAAFNLLKKALDEV